MAQWKGALFVIIVVLVISHDNVVSAGDGGWFSPGHDLRNTRVSSATGPASNCLWASFGDGMIVGAQHIIYLLSFEMT